MSNIEEPSFSNSKFKPFICVFKFFEDEKIAFEKKNPEGLWYAIINDSLQMIDEIWEW